MFDWVFDLFDLVLGRGRPTEPTPAQLRLLAKKVEALLESLDVPVERHPASLPAPVDQALRRGDKLRAVRLYREQTGASLKEAKDRVEGRAGPETDLARISALVDRAIEARGIEFDPHPGLDERIGHEARTRGKISAIKLYRRETGAGLKEAKEAVERLSR